MVPKLELKRKPHPRRIRAGKPAIRSRRGVNVKRSGDLEIDEKRRKRRDYVYQARQTERERLRELENWKPPFCTPADIAWIFGEAASKYLRRAHAA